MDIISFLVVGLIAGFLARALVPGKDPMGIVATLLLGLAGAVLGGFVAGAVAGDNTGVGIIGATLGAIVLLLAYRFVTRGRERGTAI